MPEVVISGLPWQGASRLFEALCLLENEPAGDSAPEQTSTAPQRSTLARYAAQKLDDDGRVRGEDIRLNGLSFWLTELPRAALLLDRPQWCLPDALIITVAVDANDDQLSEPDTSRAIDTINAVLSIVHRAESSTVLFAITRMDLVGFSEPAFLRRQRWIQSTFPVLTRDWKRPVQFIPVAVYPNEMQTRHVFAERHDLATLKSGHPTLESGIRTALQYGPQISMGQVRLTIPRPTVTSQIIDFDRGAAPIGSEVYDLRGKPAGEVIGSSGSEISVRVYDDAHQTSARFTAPPVARDTRTFCAILALPSGVAPGSQFLFSFSGTKHAVVGTLVNAQILTTPTSQHGRRAYDCEISLTDPATISEAKDCPGLAWISVSPTPGVNMIGQGAVYRVIEEAGFDSSAIRIDDDWVREQVLNGRILPVARATSAKTPSAASTGVAPGDYESWFTNAHYRSLLSDLLEKSIEYSDDGVFKPLLKQLLEWERFSFLYPRFTEQKRSRDHFLHALRTAVLGDFLLSLRVGEDNNVSLLDLFTAAVANRYPSAQVSENTVLRNWWLSALFHDCSYPLNLFIRPFQTSDVLRNQYDNAYGAELISELVGDNWRDMKLGSDERIRSALSRFVSSDLHPRLPEFYKPLTTGAESMDHGILAAYVVRSALQRAHHDLQSVDGTVLEAIALHNIDTEGVRIRFSQYPLAALLALCDELQEWGRPVVDLTGASGSPPSTVDLITELDGLTLTGLDSDGTVFRARDGEPLVFTMNYDVLGSDGARRSGFDASKLHQSKIRRVTERIESDLLDLPDFLIKIKPPTSIAAWELDVPLNVTRGRRMRQDAAPH